MEENANVAFELSCLASNIKKEVVGVLNSFFSFLRKSKEKNPIICFFLSWTLS